MKMIGVNKKRNFNKQTIPEGHILEGVVIIEKALLNYFYPQFNIHFKNSTITHIVSCKKQSGAIGANYYISTN